MRVTGVPSIWMRASSHRIRTTMVRDFSSSDEGMTVRTSDGAEVGTIEEIKGNMAHVKPADGLSSSIRQRLGWTAEGEEVYELRHSKVDSFSGNEVHLKD